MTNEWSVVHFLPQVGWVAFLQSDNDRSVNAWLCEAFSTFVDT